MKKQVKAVIFDLGRVVVNLHPERGLFGKFFSGEKVFNEENLTKVMQDKHIKELMRGKLSSKDFHLYMNEKFSLDMDYEDFARSWSNIFTLNQGTADLIFELSGKIKLGVLSDTDEIHWTRVKTDYDVLSLIPNPTLSFQTGFAKPEKDIYIKAAQNVGEPIENCLFFDDLSLNVQGALNVGMQAVQFFSAGQIRDELLKRKVL